MDVNLTVIVYSGNSADPIEGAKLAFESTDKAAPSFESTTDATGQQVVKIDRNLLKHYSLTVTAWDHDPGYLRPLTPDPLEFRLPPYPSANAYLGWWHRLLGVRSFDKTRGQQISIGVIDSGFANHPDLRHVQDCGVFTQAGRVPGRRGRDKLNHGTGVIGLLTARPNSPEFYAGIVPGARVLSAKAFDEHTLDLSTGTHGEVQEALNYLLEQGVDLINCSFTTEDSVLGVEDIIEDAYERGTLCICAAGNNATEVCYPASSTRTAAVSAVGLRTEGPWYCPDPDGELWQEDFFVPTFSARGTKIACCGPGVGMITTATPLRARQRASYRVFGTSFACPLVCGVLAAALSDDRTYLGLPRNESRSAYAVNKLIQLCRPLGFAARYEGAGMPNL